MKAQLAELSVKQLKDGSWFQVILQRSANRFLTRRSRRDALEPWRAKYPDADNDTLSHHIVVGSSRKAAMVGGVGGAVVTAAEIAAITTLGLPTSGAFLLVLAELALLERLQVNMVFTLGDVQGADLQHDDMRDVGMLYGQVLKVKGATRAATYTRDGATTLFRLVGVRFLQTTAVKYAIPLLSVGLGGGMNYIMTRSLGRHARRRFEQEATSSERMERMLDQEQALRTTLLSLMVLMAGADGKIDKKERALLKRTLDELAADGSDRDALLAAMDQPEETLFTALRSVGDDEFHEVVLELLALMAVTDGHLDPGEIELMHRVSSICGQPFDEGELRERYAEFLKDVKGKKEKI